MQEEFNKIHSKLEAMDAKLDNHLERIAKGEAEAGWIRMGMLGIFAWIGAKFYIFGGK